jgi:hypothetical protein
MVLDWIETELSLFDFSSTHDYDIINMLLHELTAGCYSPPPLKRISPRDYKHIGGHKRGTHTLLRREKLWILGTKELLGLPCSLFLGMMPLVNLVEVNHLSPRDSVLLTQKLHWMLWIRQVGIKRHDIINDNISGWIQTFLQLRDMEHVLQTGQGWW